MKNKFFLYLVTLIGVTLILYSASIFLSNLDTHYFELHKTELTTSQTITLQDNSEATNYYYAHTPYHYAHLVVGYGAIFLPIMLVWAFAVKLMLDERNSETFLKSLCIPIVYGIINMIFFFATMDKSLGWEYTTGMSIVFIEIIFIFVSVFVINGVILFKNKA